MLDFPEHGLPSFRTGSGNPPGIEAGTSPLDGPVAKPLKDEVPLSRIRPLAAVLGLVVVVAACDNAADTPGLIEPPTTRSAIEDARDPAFAGSGVFLLPPIYENQGIVRTAPFDLRADPRLEICELLVDGDLTVENIEAAACGDVVAWFETDAAHDGSTFIQVQPSPGQTAADSMFSIGWDTDAADANKAFRATIQVPDLTFDGGSVQVVYAPAARFDVLLYENSSNKLDPDRIVGTTAGQNFPVKFIVEEGASCDGLDCFAYVVTCEADVYRTAHAGVFMPEDWAAECDDNTPGPERSWLLFQERQPEGTDCLPLGDYAEYDGILFQPCYVWQLVEEDDSGLATGFTPYTGTFDLPVTVQFCNAPVDQGGAPDALLPLSAIFRFSEDPDELALVPDAEAPAFPLEGPDRMECPYDPDAQTGGFSLAALADEWVRPVLRTLGLEPRPLYAGNLATLSGTTIRMSDFQRLLRLQLDATGSLSQALLVGSSTEIEVRLTTPPHHDEDDAAGVPGLDVQFTIVSGSGSLAGTAGAACSDGIDCVVVTTSLDDTGTPTDEGGFAKALVTLTGEGSLVLEVTFPGDPDMPPVRYTIDAVELVTVFLEPLDTGDVYGAPDERFLPTILICDEADPACLAPVETIPTAEIKLVEEKGRKFYQADWKPRDTPAVGLGDELRAHVMVEGTEVGLSIPIIITKGGKGERIDNVYYNGINSSVPFKFTITPAP